LIPGVYNIVIFPPARKGGKETTSIVPDSWLVDATRCAWPPYRKQAQIDEAVVKRSLPGDNWSICNMRIVKATGNFF